MFVAGNGDVVTYTLAPRAVDDSTAVDRGDDVVAVAQTFELPNGRRVRVGVSMPLLAVSDGLDAVRTVLWFAVPALTAAIAGGHVARHRARAAPGARDHRAYTGDQRLQPQRPRARCRQPTTRSTSWPRR